MLRRKKISKNANFQIIFQYKNLNTNLSNYTIPQEKYPYVKFMKKNQFYVILIIITLFSVSAAVFQYYSIFQSGSLVSQTESIPKSSSSSGGGYLMDTEADFNWEEINTTGTLMTISSQSNGIENISFSEGGWNFTFYETEYDIIYVRTDGWMTFHEFYNMGHWQLPHLQLFDYDFVVLLMSLNGLNPSIGGEIYYEFLTSPNRLIIEYSQIYDDSSQLVGDFQVIYYENGTIKFQYKNLFDVFSQPPAIGLDHGDTLNYNSYTTDLPLISVAIQFTFDEMIYPNYGFEMKENDEYEYILTRVNNGRLEEYFGVNWEQIFSLPLNPSRANKIKFKITSISENATDWDINYDIWGWENRFNDFPISHDLSESLSYKKEPSDYTQKHNLTNIIPMFLPNQTLLYLTRANLSYDYFLNPSPLPTSVGCGEGKDIDGHYIYVNIIGHYNPDGLLENLYISLSNQTSNEYEVIFNMESLNPSFLEQSSLKVQSGDEHQWLLTELNETLMESIFGAKWEGKFGLPENPIANNKIKIRIESTSDNSTHWNADYSLWDWTERDSNFDISSIEVDSLNYLKDAFNYSMPHNYSTIFPYFLPKPVELYLSYSNLDESFYSIQPYMPSYYLQSLRISYDVGEYFGHGSASYSLDGYLTDIIFKLSSMMGSEITIFQLTHFNTGEKPSNVIIKPGNEFNYDIFNYSENCPPGYSSMGKFKKVNITVDYVSGDDYYLNRTIVLSNYSLMDTMGTWYTNYSLQDAFIIPVGDLMYIYQDAEDYFDTIMSPSSVGFPFMVTTNMNWTVFVAKLQTFIPYGSNGNITAFSNGYKISQAYSYYFMEMIFNFTSYGVLESFSWLNNGEEFYLIQLNYSSIEAETIDPIIIINSTLQDEVFGDTAPTFNLTISGANLDSVWYTIDNGTHNFTITELTGTINQTAWNSAANGQVTIKFYANNILGYLGTALTVVIKDVPQQTLPGIPGFNPILVLLITTIGMFSISWRIKKK